MGYLREWYSKEKQKTCVMYICSACKQIHTIGKQKFKKKKTSLCFLCFLKSDAKKQASKNARLKTDYSGENNPNYRGQTKRSCECGKIFYRRISPSQIGTRYHTYCSTDCKKKYSKSISKSIYYNRVKYRSRWEVAFAKLCRKRKLKYIYEPESFKTPYGYYIPDFFIPEKKLYVEVKGYFRDENAFKKYNWFKKKYKTLLADQDYFIENGFIFKRGRIVY